MILIGENVKKTSKLFFDFSKIPNISIAPTNTPSISSCVCPSGTQFLRAIVATSAARCSISSNGWRTCACRSVVMSSSRRPRSQPKEADRPSRPMRPNRYEAVVHYGSGVDSGVDSGAVPSTESRRQSQDPHHCSFGDRSMTHRHKGCRGAHGRGSSRRSRSCRDWRKSDAVGRAEAQRSRSRTDRLALFDHCGTRRTRTARRSSGSVSLRRSAMVRLGRRWYSPDNDRHRE